MLLIYRTPLKIICSLIHSDISLHCLLFPVHH